MLVDATSKRALRCLQTSADQTVGGGSGTRPRSDGKDKVGVGKRSFIAPKLHKRPARRFHVPLHRPPVSYPGRSSHLIAIEAGSSHPGRSSHLEAGSSYLERSSHLEAGSSHPGLSSHLLSGRDVSSRLKSLGSRDILSPLRTG